jgi:hypothetical protein
MKNKLWIPFLFLQVSCSSTKQANTPVEKNSEKKISPVTLPVHLGFYPDPPHDSVVNWVNTFFNGRNTQIITRDKMTGLVQAEAQLATQSANIKDWSDPEKVRSQVDRQTRYVVNYVRIDFSFIDHVSKQFRLKWHNELMPMKLTMYKKEEWTQVDSSLVSKYSWPESLKIAVESILSSGKLR